MDAPTERSTCTGGGSNSRETSNFVSPASLTSGATLKYTSTSSIDQAGGHIISARSMRERIALTELNAELNGVTAGVHNFAGRLTSTAEDVRDKHAAALRALDGALSLLQSGYLHVPLVQHPHGQGFMTRIRRPDYVISCAGKLSTAAARKSAAEVSAEELQQSETTAKFPQMHRTNMVQSWYIHDTEPVVIAYLRLQDYAMMLSPLRRSTARYKQWRRSVAQCRRRSRA